MDRKKTGFEQDTLLAQEMEAQDSPKKKAAICACVHGKCEEGNQYCSFCDKDWRGDLCDIPTRKRSAEPVDEEISEILEAERIYDATVADNYPAELPAHRFESPGGQVYSSSQSTPQPNYEPTWNQVKPR